MTEELFEHTTGQGKEENDSNEDIEALKFSEKMLDDKIDKDFEIIYYTGEGKEDQSLTGGNQRILDANTQNTPMFYFIEVPQEPGQRKRGALDNIYEFVGRVRYTKHVFKNEEKGIDVVKRVVGLPGETISSADGSVLINNEPISDSWARTITDDFIKYEIEENLSLIHI